MKVSIIKNPQIFSVEFPSFESISIAMDNEDSAGLFIRDIGESELNKFGINTNSPIRKMSGGYRIGFSYITKVISSKSVKQEVAKLVEVARDELGVKKNIRGNALECVMIKKAKTADIVRTDFNAYFHEKSSKLIIDATSEDLSQMAIGCMLKLLGSMKCATIYVDGIGESLSQQILKSIEQDNELGFAGFEFTDKLNLKHPEHGTSKYTGEYTLEHIAELINSGFRCERVSLKKCGMMFDFTSDLKIKSIKLTEDLESDIVDDYEHIAEDVLREIKHQEVSVELVVGVVNDLTEYFESIQKA